MGAVNASRTILRRSAGMAGGAMNGRPSPTPAERNAIRLPLLRRAREVVDERHVLELRARRRAALEQDHHLVTGDPIGPAVEHGGCLDANPVDLATLHGEKYGGRVPEPEDDLELHAEQCAQRLRIGVAADA